MALFPQLAPRFILLFFYFSRISAKQVEPHSDESANLSFPFEPPSEEFCKTNSAGDDVYLSLFKPCEFVFYRRSTPSVEVANKVSKFECANFGIDDAPIVATEQRKVVGWPDSCVANGPRCYSLADFPNLQKFTIFGDTDFDPEYSTPFPSDADAVSVDCSADYAEVEHAMDELPEVLKPIAEAMVIFSLVMLVSVIACAGLCCFGLYSCLFKSGPSASNYQAVPIVPTYSGPPVIARSLPNADGKAKAAEYHGV